MLHPVGDLPAAVYWRRRALVLIVLLALLGGAGWLVLAATSRGDDGGATAAGTSPEASRSPAAPPQLERVLPSLAGVRTPDPGARTTVAPPEERAPEEAPAEAAPSPGGPCSDDMIGLEVRTPGSIAVGDGPTLELVVTNTSPVPCTRALDKELQELVLVDAGGNRVWGSHDCIPESSDDTRTLAPGETVTFPVAWSGRTSEPSCSAARATPPAGDYVVRGRLDTKTTPDAGLRIG
ncbi:MucR family transcriptional regulator [Geodermatophilus sp. YIM 151500]|uniref:MucR family transcriptional regulator n=1 Tax=Geodermatophilus sp. YIM 151500 TaxID=2984531 RepID=UPI0021E3635B|nr:MucR family transcriptional regulator [Geodermatophilus sp. YIM 151500]MCV2489702.1 MucR family transcriptional regulator [Geodermatophilus sp. YIM 151500]